MKFLTIKRLKEFEHGDKVQISVLHKFLRKIRPLLQLFLKLCRSKIEGLVFNYIGMVPLCEGIDIFVLFIFSLMSMNCKLIIMSGH